MHRLSLLAALALVACTRPAAAQLVRGFVVDSMSGEREIYPDAVGMPVQASGLEGFCGAVVLWTKR